MATAKAPVKPRKPRPYPPAMGSELAKPVAALRKAHDLTQVEAVRAIADRAPVALPAIEAEHRVPLDEVAVHWLRASEVYRAYFAAKAAGEPMTDVATVLLAARLQLGTDDDLYAAVSVLNDTDGARVGEATRVQVVEWAYEQAAAMGLTLTEQYGQWGVSLHGTGQSAPTPSGQGAGCAAEAAEPTDSATPWVPHWLHALATDWQAINTMSLPDAAAWYARNGLPVFPRVPGQKKPLVTGGLHRATTDPVQVAAWWLKWPNANIGIATGCAFDVLDADYHPERGEDGIADIATLSGFGLTRGCVAIATTPSGGRHHLYAPDDTRSIGAQQGGPMGFALDLLGHRAAQAAPPSVNSAGQAYQWAGVDPSAYGPVIRWDEIVRVLRQTVEVGPAPYTGPASTNGTTNIAGLRKWYRELTDGRVNAVYRLALTLLGEGHDPDVLLEDIAHHYKGDPAKYQRCVANIRGARKTHEQAQRER